MTTRTHDRMERRLDRFERDLDARPLNVAPLDDGRPVTKRDHDRATKENWGYRGAMASDERAHYRARRRLPTRGWQPDRIERRGAEMAHRNAHKRMPGWPPAYFNGDGFLPTLGIASRWRAVAAAAARAASPLLGL